MLAEAENEAHQGPTDLAYKCINEIRQRAGISKLKGLSYTDFQQAVRDERPVNYVLSLCGNMIWYAGVFM